MVTENKINVSNLTNVPETMLLPLCLKAKETRANGIISDVKAVEITDQIALIWKNKH